MRIALISKWLARERERFGPGGGFVQQLAEAMLDRGHEVVALSQRRDVAGWGQEHAGRVPMHVIDAEKRRTPVSLFDKALKGWSGSRKIVTDALAIRRFLHEAGPFDAIWAQAEDPDGTACGLAARFGKIPPLVITVQAVRWEPHGDSAIRLTGQSRLNIGFSRAQVVAANSLLCARWLRENYGVPEAKLGFYRVNLTRSFLECAARAHALPEANTADQTILFLGALNPTKAPDVFLDAARLLASRQKECRFVLVGGRTEKNPTFEARLESLRQAPELRDRVTFTGALEEEDVAVAIARARLVVCPSRIDTLSRATVESLVIGRPVVVTENVGARALVEETGAGLVTPLESAALADAMERVLNTPQFAACAREHAERLATHHSASAAALQLEPLLQGTVISPAL